MNNLKKMMQWVNWIAFIDPDDSKVKKIPKNPKNGYPAKVSDPDTWGTFELAQSKVGTSVTHRHYKNDSKGNSVKDEKGKSIFQEFKCEIVGVGFIFANGYGGIDIDEKEGKPHLTPEEKQDVIQLMNTYTEYSPSGDGEHIIFKYDPSKIPTIQSEKGFKLDPAYYQKNDSKGLECYFAGLTNRFFTYTGEAINNLNIEDRTEQVLQFLDKYMRKSSPQNPNSTENNPKHHQDVLANSYDIISIAQKAKNSNKFIALFYQGDISNYNNDDSSADLALCSMLAFYCQGDFNEIDRYFRQSALYRQKWERQDYRTATINKAISGCNGVFYKPHGRPKKEKIKKEYTPEQEELIKIAQNNFGVYDDEKLTIAGVAFYLEQIGASVKYNEINRKSEITGLEKYNEKYILDNFPVVIFNDLNLQYKYCSINTVQAFLKVIMMNNAYNPVLELIENNKWDGVDHIPELYRILRIDDSDKLSKILIYKWHWQNISMLRNYKGAYGADGILVFKGGQGIGKTSYAKKAALRNEWFGEGLILDVRQKDTIIQSVSCWIGELGEIESTFKSDINALKAFITLPKDNYRVPYGRTSETLPRLTSFIGTCNSDEYLIDETGNRRYWTVPVGNIDLDALEKFDMLQLYLQIDEQNARKNPQGFRLTADERTQLAERNSMHEKPVKAEIEIRDILSKIKETDTKQELTTAGFQEKYPALNKFDAREIGRALNKIGIKKRKTNGITLYEFPISMPKTGWNN